MGLLTTIRRNKNENNIWLEYQDQKFDRKKVMTFSVKEKENKFCFESAVLATVLIRDQTNLSAFLIAFCFAVAFHERTFTDTNYKTFFHASDQVLWRQMINILSASLVGMCAVLFNFGKMDKDLQGKLQFYIFENLLLMLYDFRSFFNFYAIFEPPKKSGRKLEKNH